MRNLTEGKDIVSVKGNTLREIINNLENRYPGTKEKLCDVDRIHPSVNVYVNGVLTRTAMHDHIDADAELHFLPAISGGVMQTQEMQETDVLQPIPDRLVVLTFDDGNKSDYTNVAPLLKRYGFGATFFITEGLGFLNSKDHYVTWEEVRELHNEGFEIGNHTRHHKNVNTQSKKELLNDLIHIDNKCEENGIPKPETFCYPGDSRGPETIEVLREKRYRFARRGVGPEFPYNLEGGCGPAYDPDVHHPLVIPSTGVPGPNYEFKDFVWTVEQAKNGKIAVLTFHGVPALEHPWVDTSPELFKTYMDYLRDDGYTVIALRDLAKYVNPSEVTGKSITYFP